jgi:rubrerythrin
MSVRFNADEVFEMALQIERNGAKFYQRAADLQQDDRARNTLRELSAMEQDHEKTFASMRRDLTEQERKEMTFDPDGELPLYLRALADRQIFDPGKDPSQRLSGEDSIEDVLHMAIGLEKDSIVFYTGMKSAVPERLGAQRLDDILKEEMSHIATLGDLLRCYRR